MEVIQSLFNPDIYKSFHIIILLLCLVMGVLGLIQGSKYNIFGASKIARIFHISEYIIGITIVAFSTSLPEFFVSIRATLKGNGLIALGNIIGSNIFNITLIFMILCIFSKDIFKINWKNILLLSVINLILITLALLNVAQIPRILGFLFITSLCFMIYKSYRNHQQKISTSKTHKKITVEDNTKPVYAILIAIMQMLLGVGLLYIGSELFLNSAKAIGYRLQIPDQIIGILVVSLGTSLPELMVTVTSVYYMKKGTLQENLQDMAEGNIIGSNLFNILGVLGLTTLIVPLEGVRVVLFDILVMSILTLMLCILLMQKIIAQKTLGYILLVICFTYIFILFR